MPNELAAPLSKEDWDARVLEIKESGSIPSYEEVCELAKLSMLLRWAFKTKNGAERYDANAFRRDLVLDLEKAHGLKGVLNANTREDRAKDEVAIQFAIEDAAKSAIHFEALLLACGRILEYDVEGHKRGWQPVGLHLDCQRWLSRYLQNQIETPQRQTGPDPYPTKDRDLFIIYFLREIQKLRYPVTENDGTHSETSACHAIVQAFDNHVDVPSAKRLMNIWSDRCSRS